MSGFGGAVYSTRFGGAQCPECGKALIGCICKQLSRGPNDGIVRVSRETKGRKGKGVTLVIGAPVEANELPKLCKELKRRCGCGGTVKDGAIEIQGDQRDVLVSLLEAKGWTVKRVGG